MKKNIIESIKNPLSVIVIFAGIAEIAMTVTVVQLSESNQNIFLWFIMLFPIILIGSFFFVLYKKPAVLFSPSDYQEDKTYLASINTQNEIENLDLKVKQLEEVNKILQTSLERVVEKVTSGDNEIISTEKERLKELRNLHDLEKNNLYSFLNRELKIDLEHISEIIRASNSGYELPGVILRITKDEKGKLRTERILESFPKILNDYDQLKEIFQKRG